MLEHGPDAIDQKEHNEHEGNEFILLKSINRCRSLYLPKSDCGSVVLNKR
jgi:hypothetical protein